MIDGETKIFGIIGNPVTHSLSPIMHNRAFSVLGLNCTYLPFCVDDVEHAIKGIKALGIHGLSVTIPHKEKVIPWLDHIDPVAARIGAVNTIHLKENTLYGSNTDWIGANRALLVKTELKDKQVVLLGAGGSARAIGFGLQEEGAIVTICSRTEHTGRKLADKLGCGWVSLNDIDRLAGDVLVNATSVGMAPENDVSLVSKKGLEHFSTVMDIVYSPLQTKMLKDAEDAGCKVVNGLEMLLYQGVAQFELWTGRQAPVDLMRKTLLKATGNLEEKTDRS